MSAQNKTISFSKITYRNLKVNDVTLFQSRVNLIRGRSGTGKSSFIELCLVPSLYSLGKIAQPVFSEIPYDRFCKVTNSSDLRINKIEYIKPGSLIRSSRKSVASALDITVPLRELYARLPASMVMGLTESHFSWSSRLGRCEKCEGRGYRELPQRYSGPVRVECEVCFGARLNSRSLQPRFKGYNLAEIMNLTLEQVTEVFENHKIIVNRVERACKFGLNYIQPGQGMDSLSGGELQRLNLTVELSRSNLDGAWFILNHPGTGLHGPDIDVLGELMQVMTRRGASFVLVENREEFLPFADQVINFEAV